MARGHNDLQKTRIFGGEKSGECRDVAWKDFRWPVKAGI
jgi:hypothetical protein